MNIFANEIVDFSYDAIKKVFIYFARCKILLSSN